MSLAVTLCRCAAVPLCRCARDAAVLLTTLDLQPSLQGAARRLVLARTAAD